MINHHIIMLQVITESTNAVKRHTALRVGFVMGVVLDAEMGLIRGPILNGSRSSSNAMESEPCIKARAIGLRYFHL